MPDIRHLVFIKSTTEKIYEAITTQKGIASWWSIHNNAKPQPGSLYRISFGGDYYKEIKVAELFPNKRVVWEILHATPEWLNTKLFLISAWEKIMLNCGSIIPAGKSIPICLRNAIIIGAFTWKI
jgi:uncharacterized protein YndB with AHSA1/START domain